MRHRALTEILRFGAQFLGTERRDLRRHSCSKRKAADLTPGAMIGDEAAKRALRRLGARKVESQTAAVIFDNRLARSLIGPLISAISGPSIARGVSFLKDQLGASLTPSES